MWPLPSTNTSLMHMKPAVKNDISTTGFITFVNDTDPIKDITVNIVRLELSVNAEEGGE